MERGTVPRFQGIAYKDGAIIVKGMPTGLYDGYDKEIHEVFVYNSSEMLKDTAASSTAVASAITNELTLKIRPAAERITGVIN